MKKMLKVFGIIAVAICLIVSIVACDKNGGKDSIDVVAVSEKEYASVEDALKGYVKEELASSVTYSADDVEEIVKAEYVSNESKGAVVADKIKLSDEQKTGFVSAEKFAVKAKIKSELVKEDVIEVTQTVYVLKYGEKFKFMVSTPEVGERATNSYFKMIADASKFENCILTEVVRSFEDEDGESEFEAVEIKFTTEASYQVSYYDETRYNNRAPGRDENTGDRQRYVVNYGNSFASVENRYDENGEETWSAYAYSWEDITTVKGYNKYSIEEIFFFTIYAPLFIKTADCLELKTEITSTFNKEDGEFKVVVTNDKITKIDIREAYTYTNEDGTTDVEGYDVKATINNFGTTAVSVPAKITEALEQLAE